MKIVHEESFGIIPVAKIDGVWQVFIIDQLSKRGDSHWTFPKGHADADELSQETAKRELFEETGLTTASIDEKCSFTEFYVFRDGDREVEKTVTYYLGYIEDITSSLQADEVRDGAWLPLKLAQERLTFESKRELIDELSQILKQ